MESYALRLVTNATPKTELARETWSLVIWELIEVRHAVLIQWRAATYRSRGAQLHNLRWTLPIQTRFSNSSDLEKPKVGRAHRL